MALSDVVKTEIPYELIKSIRQAYGITVENHPRSNIIVGTTNAESGFLRDITGNRRFWPVEVAAMAYDAQKEALECDDREGIIREYVKSYRWLGKVIVKQNWENKICFICPQKKHLLNVKFKSKAQLGTPRNTKEHQGTENLTEILCLGR